MAQEILKSNPNTDSVPPPQLPEDPFNVLATPVELTRLSCQWPPERLQELQNEISKINHRDFAHEQDQQMSINSLKAVIKKSSPTELIHPKTIEAVLQNSLGLTRPEIALISHLEAYFDAPATAFSLAYLAPYFLNTKAQAQSIYKAVPNEPIVVNANTFKAHEKRLRYLTRGLYFQTRRGCFGFAQLLLANPTAQKLEPQIISAWQTRLTTETDEENYKDSFPIVEIILKLATPSQSQAPDLTTYMKNQDLLATEKISPTQLARKLKTSTMKNLTNEKFQDDTQHNYAAEFMEIVAETGPNNLFQVLALLPKDLYEALDPKDWRNRQVNAAQAIVTLQTAKFINLFRYGSEEKQQIGVALSSAAITYLKEQLELVPETTASYPSRRI